MTIGVGTRNGRELAFFGVHDHYGNFVSYVPRVLDNSEPKYDFSDLSKTQYLYNYHRAKAAGRQAVIIVEGFVDAVKLIQAGYPSVVSLMGSVMSERQEHLLLRWWEHFIFMLDGDAAGRKSQKEFIERLNRRGVKGVYGINLPDKVQPDQLSPEEVQQYISKSR